MTRRRRAAERPAPPERPTPRGFWWRPALILVAVVLTYSNSLSGAFVLDDQSTIVSNQQIRDFWNPSAVLSPERDTAIAGRPIVNLSFAINYAIGGLAVRGYHVGNIAIHLLCALLAFGVIRRTLELPRMRERFGARSLDMAFAIALLWAVHPLNSEVVDYLTERTESLMALFFLLTLYACVRGVRLPPSNSAPDRGWSLLAIASCALGMACKESMVTAPVIVLLYDRIFVFDSFGQAIRARRGLYAGLASGWIVLAALIWSGPRSGVGGFSTGVPIWTWLLNQTVMIAHYLRLTVWPRGLVVFYGWPLSLTLADVWPQALLIISLGAVTAFALARAPAVGFLGAWFFITLAPTSSIIPIATEVGAERRMYLPLLALIALAVVAVYRLVGPPEGGPYTKTRTWVPALAGTILLGAITVGLAMTTFARNREYESPLILARTVVDRRPSGVTHHYLAEQLSLTNQHEEAIAHLREAVARGDSRAYYLLGFELFNAGKLSEASQQLEAFVRTAGLPYRLVPRWLEPPVSEVLTARLVLARAASMQRGWPKAEEETQKVLAVAPGNREARILLADALFNQRRYEEAGSHYREYLKFAPNDPHALNNLGVVEIADGRLDEAIVWFRRSVEAQPKDPNARRMLGMALLDRGDFEGAAAQARQGVALAPNEPAMRELLASAESAGRGRRPESGR